MKKLILIISMVTISSFACVDLELRPLMSSIGKGFKLTVKAVRSNQVSEANIEIARLLSENIKLSKNVLPVTVDPIEEDKVTLYKEIMEELYMNSIALQENLSADPFDVKLTMKTLGKMNSLRKKGHEIFR